MRGVLGLVASACGGIESRLCDELARPAADRGWRLAITLTPTAARWLTATGELDRLAAHTDLPVRSTSRLPTEPRPHPDPDCFVFAPASANSVAKLASGIGDNQALTVLCEALGNRVPMVVCPRVGEANTGHPAWRHHLTVLRSADVVVLPMPPDQSWTAALDALDELIADG
jgi:Flavoprotein